MAAITIDFPTFHFSTFHFSKYYSSIFLRSDGNDTRCSQQRADCAMSVKNECKEKFARRSAKFTGLLVLEKEPAVRLPWTVITVFT